MLKTLIVFLFCLSLFSIDSVGQNRFRVETVGDTQFILPPKSKLKANERGELKERHRYHFVEVVGLGGVYSQQAAKLDDAKYYYSKKHVGQSGSGDFQDIAGCEKKCAIKYSYAEVSTGQKTGFVLRIDYEAVLRDRGQAKGRSKVAESFRVIANALLKHFASGEEQTGARSWNPVLAQAIVEKAFELVPVPQEASLMRYGADIDQEQSFVLLNPKIFLKVDHASQSNQGGQFQYRLTGQTILRLYMSDDGRFKQLPFIRFDDRVLPNNTLADNGELQASSGDIQLSEGLKGNPVIALYQNYFKRNNNSRLSTPGTSLYCTKADDATNMRCNSILLHAGSVADFLTASGVSFDYEKITKILNGGQLVEMEEGQQPPDCEVTKDCAPKDDSIRVSFFGGRNLITPVINIFVNGQPTHVDFNSTLSQLANGYGLPRDLKFFRQRGGKYFRFQDPPAATLLLPGDKVIF